MFGIYSNQRISERESKLLAQNPDDYNWYNVYVATIFKDDRYFQIREDIKLPQEDDDNGVVLMFPAGNVTYFKTLDGDVTREEADSIFDVCLYLHKMFNRHIKAYIVIPPDAKMLVEDIGNEGEVTIFFSKIGVRNGEEVINRLQSKLEKGEEFSIQDSIDHMLLPYTGFKNKKRFKLKFEHYMNLVNGV